MPAKVDETNSSDSQGGSASYRHTQLCHCGNLTVSLPSETTKNNVRASSLPLIESTLDLSCLGSFSDYHHVISNRCHTRMKGPLIRLNLLLTLL